MKMSRVPIHARINTASPRWLPRNLVGLTTNRLIRAMSTPVRTATEKMSWANAMMGAPGTALNMNPCHSASTTACAMAVRRTRNPQKIRAWSTPAYGQRSRRPWARTYTPNALSLWPMWSNLGSGRVPLRIAPNSFRQRRPVATVAVPASSTRKTGLRSAITLPPRPRRRALLQERGDALTCVITGEDTDELAALDLERLRERAVESLGDGALGGSDGQRRLGGETTGDVTGGAEQCLGLDDAGHQSECQRARRVDGIAGEEQLHRRAAADQAGQALGATPPGDDAELDLGLAEARVGRGDAHVARHGDLAAAAEGDAVDGADDGQGRAFHRQRQHLATGDVLASRGPELGDAGAGREELGAGAGEDRGPAAVIGLGLLQRLGDTREHGAADCVGRGVLDGNDRQSAVALDSNRVVQNR